MLNDARPSSVVGRIVRSKLFAGPGRKPIPLLHEARTVLSSALCRKSGLHTRGWCAPKIVERTTRGRQFRLSQGQLMGAGTNTFGYDYIRKSPNNLPRMVIINHQFFHFAVVQARQVVPRDFAVRRDDFDIGVVSRF